MESSLLQDWTTISMGAAGGNTIQSEPLWLDLHAYRDVVAFLEVKALSNAALVLNYQTSVAKDEALFVNMASLGGATPINLGLTVTSMLQDTTSIPVARWFRWQAVLAAQAWNITFRIWLAINRPGSVRSRNNNAQTQR